MKVTIFAAIEIASYEVGMKIYALSQKSMKEITYVRHRIELGKDAYRFGKISNERMDELCEVLTDFKRIMKEYGATEYRACATAVIRELDSSSLILDRIFVKTGINVEVLSNSESRFLSYKSIASQEKDFDKIIQKGTAIIDVGGESIQISLFDKDALVSTQNIRIGTNRLKERLSSVYEQSSHFEQVVEEIANNALKTYRKLYLKDRKIENIILIGDYSPYISRYINVGHTESHTMSAEEYQQFYNEMLKKNPQEMLNILGIPAENEALMLTTLVVYRKLIEETEAKEIWMPALNLCDGLTYDYGEKNKILQSAHDFENDIIVSAKNMGKRYQSNKNHVNVMTTLALTIFDKTKTLHGMQKRDRLLLHIAVLLHDCGKFISMSHAAECAYNIIMASEIIGLSHEERELVANIVKYNSTEMISFEEFARSNTLNRKQYIKVCKLAAILRVSNAMDRSHKQKIQQIRVTLKENRMILTVDTPEDITLEQGLLREKAEFFEDVFGMTPVLRRKKNM
jgi:exopolyphosphatase/guanosine-5'-triphosphate,3'-diphosphate pyrophosphatase